MSYRIRWLIFTYYAFPYRTYDRDGFPPDGITVKL